MRANLCYVATTTTTWENIWVQALVKSWDPRLYNEREVLQGIDGVNVVKECTGSLLQKIQIEVSNEYQCL